jgi:hypothetical protein
MIEKLHEMYSSPNVIGAIKSTRMRRVGRVAKKGVRSGEYGILVWKHE